MKKETLIQFFHWYYPADGSLWNNAAQSAEELKQLGFTGMWLPPSNKTKEGAEGVGYSVYDLYDLGEFDQKGTVRTKYGTKDEYIKCAETLKKNGIKPIVDVVLNHRNAGDEIEKIWVKDVNFENRNELQGEAYEIELLTKFTFPGRKGKYSEFIWDHRCFTGIEAIDNTDYFFAIMNEYGEGWDEVPSEEMGNFDYLLGADVEFRNPHVREELRRWGKWFLETVGFQGIRLDAVKHISVSFINKWMDYMVSLKSDLLWIAEYWSMHLEELLDYTKATRERLHLFDVPLHYNFFNASLQGEAYDLSKVFENTFVQKYPHLAVTFVENHDTQPLQSLESTVDFWFKPLGYALTLLRKEGMPCVFYPCMYGAKYTGQKEGIDVEVDLVAVPHLRDMLELRKSITEQTVQRDYFDAPNNVGWVLTTTNSTPVCMAILLSNSAEAEKQMEVGKEFAGKSFYEYLGTRQNKVVIDTNGKGIFTVNAGSVAVWLPE